MNESITFLLDVVVLNRSYPALANGSMPAGGGAETQTEEADKNGHLGP